jgi:hypothetical protein
MMKSLVLCLLLLLIEVSHAGFKCVDIDQGLMLENIDRQVIISDLQTQETIRVLRQATIGILENQILVWPRVNNHGGSAIVFQARKMPGLKQTFLGAGLGLKRAICELN